MASRGKHSSGGWMDENPEDSGEESSADSSTGSDSSDETARRVQFDEIAEAAARTRSMIIKTRCDVNNFQAFKVPCVKQTFISRR